VRLDGSAAAGYLPPIHPIPEGKGMNTSHFTDDIIEAIRSGKRSLTQEERYFLIHDTLTFEECEYADTELATMDDPELMRAAYGVWADYAAGL
jgi:hypothetical protein